MKEKEYIFYQNPFYHYVFGFASENMRVPSRSRGKRKEAAKESVKEIAGILDEMKEDYPEFPISKKHRLIVVISITGSERYLETVDIDNLSKMVLDLMKSRIFQDDHQVYQLYMEKQVFHTNGFLVGVKKIDKNGPYVRMVPELFSLKPYRGTTWHKGIFTKLTNMVKLLSFKKK
jgi:Holliday junction resolvase RusA-like endonuclease